MNNFISVIEICAENENKLVQCSRNGKNEQCIQNNFNEIDKKLIGTSIKIVCYKRIALEVIW